MKNQSSHRQMLACLIVAALTFLGTASAVHAATLKGTLFIRPLTPTEKDDYGLSATNEASGGLSTVTIGQPAYLDAMVTNNLATVTNVTWTLATNPPGSAAQLLASPLGPNVPPYNPADQNYYNVASRRFLRPDVIGTYTVNVKIQTSNAGSTNLSVNITGGQYLSVNTCASCHNGTFPGVPNIYSTYTNTPHASFFTKAIDGLESSHYSKNCIVCHVLGYDTNAFAVSLGFYDFAKIYNWQFPTVLTNGNWAAMPTDLQHLSNIQCEHCHGAGNLHQFSGGITGNTNAISISFGAGVCNQCHDDLNNHYKGVEWSKSGHANMTRIPSGGANRIACVRCHTAMGFEEYVENLGSSSSYVTNYNFEALTCQGCHDPHDASNPEQLRTGTTVTFNGNTGFTVTNAGLGGFCMNCHNSRNGSVSNSIVQYSLLQTTWNGGSSFGPHDSPQGDMLEGINGYTYGQVIPSSPHANVVSNTCVGCHMQPIASSDPAFTLAGGHTTLMSYVNTNGVTVDVTYVCTQCHGQLTSFDFPVADYNGDGIIEGVQTEIQHLMDKLSTLLPPPGYQANPNYYVASGQVQTSISTYTNMPAKFLEAAYNWQFVYSDSSHGVHNAAYAVGLLKASIGNLTGDNNGDGLPDSWQQTYFGAGFATNPAAGPNAVNNTAGVPNWMMCTLNSSPFGAFTVDNSGTIFINGANIVNGATNTLAIYKAAEIAFNTQVGVKYQIQGVSQLTGTWQNISTNLPGTGTTISYLTPTRNNLQMFFRVVQTAP